MANSEMTAGNATNDEADQSSDGGTAAEMEPGGSRLRERFRAEIPAIGAVDVDNDLADRLVAFGHRSRASDIHLDPQEDGSLLRLRIDGALHDVARIEAGAAAQLVNQFKVHAGLDLTTVFSPEDARWTQVLDDAELDIRMTIVPCLGGPKIALRLLDRNRAALSLDELGMLAEQQDRIESWLATVSGLVVCAGPIGSGKTTTLYALLRELVPRQRQIATIEDPPEYSIAGVNQVPVDTGHGIDFVSGLRAILRMDPDYVMVGEAREAETARVLIDAANAGRVALTTMHARDAISAVAQLRQWSIPDHTLAANTSVIISQRLVRRLCPHCRREGEPTGAERAWFAAQNLELGDTCWHPVGCERCRGIGYHDRVGLFEVWLLDEDDAAAIRDGATGYELHRQLDAKGFRRLLDDGLGKIAAGDTSIDEVRRAAIPLHARPLDG